MKLTMKSILLLVGLFAIHMPSFAELNPDIFIDKNAQAMVQVITSKQALYNSDPESFQKEINIIFEPMVDFRRVGASVMGKQFYMQASKEQRLKFISVFKKSLLDTYTSTLAQWGDQTIETKFIKREFFNTTEDVNQLLITSNNIYPVTYKVRKNKMGGWLIINIIVNGVNLGLTFRNQFRALATEYDNDIDEIINNWISDASL
ncbi:ABC transporter substrate-binding protein [Gammaproteobacteria bacterium]|nr:ABC transporter substrate-binding protein [Gammaproteobacteria bacterium]